MMESLTDEIAEKALEIIKEVEESGGMTKYINSGAAKLRIEESATKKQGRIDSGQEVIVGVNKYRLSEEEERAGAIDVLQIDNKEVRAKQIARIEKVKSNRDEAAAQAAPACRMDFCACDETLMTTKLTNSMQRIVADHVRSSNYWLALHH